MTHKTKLPPVWVWIELSAVLYVTVVSLLLLWLLVTPAHAEPTTGLWPRSDGTMGTAHCPTAAEQIDGDNIIRLPVGCLVLSPRLGYTVAQDLHARDELAVLRATVPAVRLELQQSREHADAILMDSRATLSRRDEALKAERDKANGLQIQVDAAKVESAALRSQRNWCVCLLVGGLVGALIVGLQQ